MVKLIGGAAVCAVLLNAAFFVGTVSLVIERLTGRVVSL